MTMKLGFVLTLLVVCGLFCQAAQMDSMDKLADQIGQTRDNRMEWWRQAKFGMFIHWGLYAVHGGQWQGRQHKGYSEWVVQNIPVDEYKPLVNEFNPVDFDPDAWVALAKEAGMRYIVITGKHHEGFAMWNSAASEYDIMETPFKRDVIKELAEACKKQGIRFGVYYSVLDWYHPDYIPRRKVDNRPTDNVDYNRYVDYMKAQLRELLTGYGPISVLWFDGDWEHGPEQHRSVEVCDMVYQLQPDIIVNDRIGLPMDYATPEQWVPDRDIPSRDWETCMTITSSWGYNKGATDWKPAVTLLRNLVDIVSKGGNYLLNVGPAGTGVITQQEAERLRQIGKWMKVNGESIYQTLKSPFRSKESTPWGRCTMKKLPNGRERLYLHVFEWPENSRLIVPELGSLPEKAYLLGDTEKTLTFERQDNGICVNVPDSPIDPMDTVVVLDFAGSAVTFHEPEIEAPADIIFDSSQVRLTTPSKGLQVHYTLDGSEPTAESSIYKTPIRLTDTTTVKAQAYYEGKAVSNVVKTEFKKVKPLAAKKVENAAPGLKWQYYEGSWEKLPEFNKMTVKASGSCGGFDLSVRKQDENFGLCFDGYIRVPKDGIYLFVLTSDDGSRLSIDDTAVVDLDGLHSIQSKDGRVSLSAGMHRIRLDYMNGLGGKFLRLKWASPGETLKVIEDSVLFHKP